MFRIWRLAVADEIIGGYRLLKNLATGQASQVWEVVENNSGRHFAMKLLLPEKAEKPELRKMLLREAKVEMSLAHPNIIRIVHVEPSPTNPYFIMEFFPAGDLKSRMRNATRDPKAKTFLLEYTQDILKQTATALAFSTSKGWIHRDVKPENVLVNSAGEVRVIDYALAYRAPTGLAKWFGKKEKTQGTRSYMSPEQIRSLILDARADIYSFGATAYEVVTGRPPFRAATSQDLLKKHIVEKPLSPVQINPDVTDQFANLVLQMLAKKKEDRPKDFHEVLIAMRALKVYKNVEPKSFSE
jgi:eukaryotic-like serine/threonine-protein kinase